LHEVAVFTHAVLAVEVRNVNAWALLDLEPGEGFIDFFKAGIVGEHSSSWRDARLLLINDNYLGLFFKIVWKVVIYLLDCLYSYKRLLELCKLDSKLKKLCNVCLISVIMLILLVFVYIFIL